MARTHRADFPLRDATAADLDWLVRTPTSGMVPEVLLRADVCDRAWDSLPDLCTETPPLRCLRCDCRIYDVDCCHGQLLLFQSPRGRPLCIATRRRGAA